MRLSDKVKQVVVIPAYDNYPPHILAVTEGGDLWCVSADGVVGEGDTDWRWIHEYEEVF